MIRHPLSLCVIFLAAITERESRKEGQVMQTKGLEVGTVIFINNIFIDVVSQSAVSPEINLMHFTA
jgi:hypothetical protein